MAMKQHDGKDLIRAFAPGDGEWLAAIYRRAVEKRTGDDYSDLQRSAWISIAPSGEVIEAFYGDGRLAFVAVDEREEPVGFSDLEKDGHIQFLYVAPEAAGRSIGTRLIATLEQAAREEGLDRLYSEASETALPVFLKSGFKRLQRRDLMIDGVAIHNYSVEKRL